MCAGKSCIFIIFPFGQFDCHYSHTMCDQNNYVCLHGNEIDKRRTEAMIEY